MTITLHRAILSMLIVGLAFSASIAFAEEDTNSGTDVNVRTRTDVRLNADLDAMRKEAEARRQAAQEAAEA